MLINVNIIAVKCAVRYNRDPILNKFYTNFIYSLTSKIFLYVEWESLMKLSVFIIVTDDFIN